MGLCGAVAGGCSGEAPVVIRVSLKRGWLQTDVVVSGDVLWCTDVRPKVGNHSISVIHDR